MVNVADKKQIQSPDSIIQIEKELEELDCTVLIPSKDQEIEDSQIGWLRDLDRNIGSPGAGELLESFGDVDNDGNVSHIEINPAVLLSIALEHQWYTKAQGFTSNEVEVLRALEELAQENNPVHITDLRSHFGLGEEGDQDREALFTSESTLYNALNNLEEKDLVGNNKNGLWKYTGPSVR